MHQTLLALLTLTLVTLYGINHRQARTQLEQNLMRAETHSVAMAAAADLLDSLEQLPFDPATANGQTITSTTQLQTIPATGSKTFNQVQTLSDLKVVQPVTLQRSTHEGTLTFNVAFAVSYVQRSGNDYVDTSTPTYTKRVTLTITSPQWPSGQVYTLPRLFRYSL